MAGPGEHTVRLAGTLRRVGEYVYLPFDVPAGTNRVHVRLDAPADVAVGTGLFPEQGVVRCPLPVGPTGGYVRAELRDTRFVDPEHPMASRTYLEVLTNPVFLEPGPPPPGLRPDPTAPPAV